MFNSSVLTSIFKFSSTEKFHTFVLRPGLDNTWPSLWEYSSSTS